MPRLIPLAQRSFTLVDDADYEWAMQWRWGYVNGYAVARINMGGRPIRVSLHRVLINPLPGFYVDHINRNPRDNRRCNLRAVSPSENVKNSERNSRWRLVLSLLKPGEAYGGFLYGMTYEQWRYTMRRKGQGIDLSYDEMTRRIELHYVEQILALVPPQHRLPLPALLAETSN